MRYLNKIVFINSAHVPYAEIKLDGNVHFIGTQGVGKSTLLRAILFFYNADKSKLGIRTQDKQKSYDEFYLPHPNSYIIYEVVRETGTFFVMTFLSRGRTAFRIVDCAYNRHFFIDDEGMARNEWGRISEAIGTKIFKSNIIRGYEEFRDIIYGNIQSVQKELRRFSIMESAKYQNIPRTIQNIFLNQSIESRIIKDTIIDSMDFSNDCIELNRYREELKSFRQQYEDIWKWYKPEKNGKVKVQTDAQEVLSKYVLYDTLCRGIKEFCGYLNYAVKRDSDLLPSLAGQETTLQNHLSEQKRLLSDEQRKYDAERDQLNQTLGVIKDFLRQAKEKRQHYESIGIEQIIEKIGHESELQAQAESLRKQEDLLTNRNQEITLKYEALKQEQLNTFHKIENGTNNSINSLDRELNAKTEEFRKAYLNDKDNIDSHYQTQQKELQKDLDESRANENELRLQQQRLSTTNPYEEETREIEDKKELLQNRQIKLTKQIANTQQEISQAEKEIELQVKDLQHDCSFDTDKIEGAILSTKEDIAKCDELLSRQKGSFIEWLCENVPNWQSTIGKIANEESVLYNTQLAPTKQASTDTVYGVKIHLENISRNIRTPKDIEDEKVQLQTKIEMLHQQLLKRKDLLEEQIEEKTRKSALLLKSLREKKLGMDAENVSVSQSIDRSNKELKKQQEKLSAWREQEQENLHKKQTEADKRTRTLLSNRKELDNQHKEAVDGLQKNLNQQVTTMEEDSKRRKKELLDSLENHRKEANKRQAELQDMMDAELKGKGIDMAQLQSIRQKRNAAQKELDYIGSNKEVYATWLVDKKGYFDNEMKKAADLQTTEKNLETLNKSFEERHEKLNTEIQKLKFRI